MITAVIDTNVLIVAVAKSSPHNWIFQRLLDGDFTLCVTTDILDEYAEILEQFYSPRMAQNIMETLENLPNVTYLTRYYRLNLITQDPDDNKFVDCALFSGSGHIITHDRHFNVLKNIGFPQLQILTADQFKLLFEKEHS